MRKMLLLIMSALMTLLLLGALNPAPANAATSNNIVHVVDAGDWDPPIIIWCRNGNRYNVYEGQNSKQFCGTVDYVYNYADSKIQVKNDLNGEWVNSYTLYGWQDARPTFEKHRTTRA